MIVIERRDAEDVVLERDPEDPVNGDLQWLDVGPVERSDVEQKELTDACHPSRQARRLVAIRERQVIRVPLAAVDGERDAVLLAGPRAEEAGIETDRLGLVDRLQADHQARR